MIDFSITAFVASLLFVVLAEMGDKTQLLAIPSQPGTALTKLFLPFS